MSKTPIRWVFLDVGNVLLDEDPLTHFVFRRHVEAVRRVRPDRTFRDLLAAREARAAAASPFPVYEAVAAFLGDDACSALWDETARAVRDDFPALCPPVAGAAPLVDRLARRYRLGLIANQGTEARAWLGALGLLDAFEVVAFSEEVGATKPDPALFRHALTRAAAEPSECLMVGDRLDNDLRPASAVGMATAWVRWPRRAAKGWQPDDPDAIAYLESLERVSERALALWPDVRPTLAIDEVRTLDAALAGVGA